MWLKETRASIKLGYPLILTNLAQIAILTTNTIYFGQLGKAELAAAYLAASLYQVTMIFSLGLVSATVPMLANVLGQRRSNRSEEHTSELQSRVQLVCRLLL